MKMNSSQNASGAALVLLAFLLQAGATQVKAEPGFVPYGGGVQLREQNWPAPPPFIVKFRHDTDIKFLLDTGWDKDTTACDSIKSSIGAAGANNGQTLYDISCSMSTSGQQLSIKDEFAGDAFELDYFVPGNYLEMTSTQPKFGKWADPRFSVTYDLDLILTMRLNGPSQPWAQSKWITVSAVRTKVSNAKADTHGAIADGISDFTSMMKVILGGDSFKEQIQQGINGAPINAQTSQRLQQAFSGIANDLNGAILLNVDPGFTEMHGAFDSGQVVLTFGGKTYDVPTTGTASISGTVSWTKSDAHPDGVAPCSDITVQAQTAAGPGTSKQFPPYTKVGNMDTVPIAMDRGTYIECRYTVSHLPLGTPLLVQARASARWLGARGALKTPRAYQCGWSGNVTVLPKPSSVVLNRGFAEPHKGPCPFGAGANPKGWSMTNIDFQLTFEQQVR